MISTLLPSNINSTVTKIASGGYITAALTSSNDIYIWGSSDPVHSRSIVPDLSGDPTPLLLQHPEDPDWEFDFLDMGIGTRHLIVLTTDQRIFTIGANRNGQLGLGDDHIKDEGLIEKWAEVDTAFANPASGSITAVEVVGVAAGRDASFVVVDR